MGDIIVGIIIVIIVFFAGKSTLKTLKSGGCATCKGNCNSEKPCIKEAK